MSKYRRAAKIDMNQPEIVDYLRGVPGISVQVGMDDILVGYNNKNYWYEIKEPGMVSNVTGKVHDSKIKDSQKKLLESWSGHYRIVWDITQILEDLGIAG